MSTFYRGPNEEEEESDEPETSSLSDEVADWYSRYDGYGKDDIDDDPGSVQDSFDAFVEDPDSGYD